MGSKCLGIGGLPYIARISHKIVENCVYTAQGILEHINVSCSRVSGAEGGGCTFLHHPAQTRGQGHCVFCSCILFTNLVLVGVGDGGEMCEVASKEGW